MIASLRGLIALTALAVALAIAVVIDRPASGVTRSARLFEKFEPDAATRIELGDAVAVRDGAWRVDGALAGPADPVVIADVLGAIELASAERWVSEAEAARAGAGLDAGRRIAVEAGARYELTLGAEAGGQVWARAGGRVALIAGWVARALDRDAAALRRRAVVPTARPTGVELHAGVDLVTSGDPAVAHLGVGNVRLAPAMARALADALAALRLTSFPADPPAAAVGTLRVLGGAEPVDLEDRGPCADGRRFTGTSGDGCAAGWDAVLAAASAILDDVTAAVDPSPLAASPVQRLERADATVERRGGGWTLTVAGADQPPDDDAIDTLIEALRAPGRVVPLAGDPAAKATLTVIHTDGASERLALVDSVAGPALRRDAEPFALVVSADALAISAGLVDRGLIAEEWTRLTRVLIEQDGVTTDVTRGASLDAWTVAGAPAPPRLVTTVTTIRDLLIDLRADSIGGDPVANPARTILVHYDAPPVVDAEPADHELRVSSSCHATIDGEVTATLSAADCAVLLAPL